MFTLRNYELWTNVERTDLPAYLKRTSAQNETLFGLPPASVPGLGRSNVAHAQRCLSLLWPRIRDDYAHYFECPKLDDIRGDFSQKLETILPETQHDERGLSSFIDGR